MISKTCTFLLLLGMAVPALAGRCPDRNRLPTNCECDEDSVADGVDVELSCTSSTPEELTDALHLFDTNCRLEVQMDEMNLQSLPPRVFDRWNMVKLEISHCQLDSLAPQGHVTLAGLEHKLESLVMSSSFSEVNQVIKIDLSHLHRLRELDLSYSAITEVSDDWFARGPESLTTLIFSNNGIEKIGDRAFANLVNLNQLWLDGNRFGPIKRSMLPRPANRLQNFEIDNNAFIRIPEDLFADMPALKDLSIKTNLITHLPEEALKPIWSQLESFDARGNPLECDSTMEWFFDAKTKAKVLGTCEGPLDRRDMDLKDFIQNRGH